MAHFNGFHPFTVGLPSPLESRSRGHSNEPKEGTMNPTVPASGLSIVDQLRLPERAPSALFTAVAILFGSIQANLYQPTQRDWRADWSLRSNARGIVVRRPQLRGSVWPPDTPVRIGRVFPVRREIPKA